MTDQNIRESVYAFIGGLILIAILAFTSSGTYQHWTFMRQCTDSNTQEYCENLWRLGNE